MAVGVHINLVLCKCHTQNKLSALCSLPLWAVGSRNVLEMLNKSHRESCFERTRSDSEAESRKESSHNDSQKVCALISINSSQGHLFTEKSSWIEPSDAQGCCYVNMLKVEGITLKTTQSACLVSELVFFFHMKRSKLWFQGCVTTHSTFTTETSQSYHLNRSSEKELASSRDEFPLQSMLDNWVIPYIQNV